MDIAVKYEKINLGNERYVFKPVSIIKGKYDADADAFETNYGELCANIEGDNQFEDAYFGWHITLDDLKQTYKDQGLTEEEMLTQYFDECVMYFCLGQFDYMEGRMQILSIPYEDAEKFFESEEEMYIPTEDGVKVKFDIEELKKLRAIDDIEKIHEKLDGVILCAKTIEENDKLLRDSLVPIEPKETKKANKMSLKKEESKLFSLKELRKEVLSSIIGQDEAVNDITRALAINYTSKNPKNKSHILVTGPSGTGKTEIINIIANRLNMPVFKADATAYTKSGYQGKEVNSMLAGLLSAANGDLEAAQNGILIIDEIDKKGGDIDSKEGDFDRAVFHSLLKIMDRDVVEVDLSHGQTKLFDTSNITVILMGSFDTLYEKKQMYKSKPIGFDKTVEPEVTTKTRIDEDDLIKWLGSEFEGRIGLITSTDELTLDDAVKILYKSKISQLKIIKEDLENRGIKFTYTSGYVRELAKQGLNKKTGARKLNKTVKNSFKYAYDEILTNDNIKVLKFTKKTALDPRKYYTE